MIIYIVTNLTNNKKYIGKTTRSLKRRRGQHENDTKNYENTGAFHCALKKYGFDNFVWEIIDQTMFIELLNELEKYYIKKMDSRVPNGYNLTGGGEGLYNPSEETRKKISDIHKVLAAGSNNPMFGRHHTKEAKQKQSLMAIGRKNPWLANKNRGLRGEDHPSFGKKRPDLSLRNRIHCGCKNSGARNVRLISPDGSVHDMLSYAGFCKEHGLDRSSITKVLKNKITNHKGWTGQYLEAK